MVAVGKLRAVSGGYAAYCPGCEAYHLFDQRWQFNGDFTRPTFNPSLQVRSGNTSGDSCCHSFVTDGFWRYLSDSTHSLKGQKVVMQTEEKPLL